MQLIKEWRKYKKSLVAAVGIVLTGANVLYSNNPWVQAVIAVATFLGVFQVRNEI